MKTFVSVGIGLVVGVIIGIAATFKAAEKKAGEIIEEELAETRRAQRGDCRKNSYTEEKVEECTDFVGLNRFVDSGLNIGTKSSNSKTIRVFYDEITGQYEPAKKPYILEDKPANFAESYPFLSEFSELNVVYDRDRGRVADEDGCEVFDIKGCLGFNNLNRLFSDEKYSKTNIIHIVCERDGMVYIAHAGDLYEYIDEECDDND